MASTYQSAAPRTGAGLFGDYLVVLALEPHPRISTIMPRS
jgi:hypothetical protein